MRPSETLPLALEHSRCGEIYVSNKADKWTFYCAYCQKGTSDIGVFICHIRLDHLSSLLDCELPGKEIEEECLPETHSPTIEGDNTFAKVSSYETDFNLIKEETLSQYSYEQEPSETSKTSKTADPITSMTARDETENIFSAKNSISAAYPTIDINEEYFTITSKEPDLVPQEEEELLSVQENQEIVRVVYNKNEKNFNNDDAIASDDVQHIYNIETSSVFSLDEDDDDDGDDDDLLIANDMEFENIDDNKASSSSKWNKANQKANQQHVCDFCNMHFKLRSKLNTHLKKVHKQKFCKMPLKCKECKKAFRSIAGYRNHLNSHDERHQKQCPVCKATHNRNYFVTHVMSHESSTCFPCIVCGKVFFNPKTRMKHWETHAKDKPFACDSCYRRFRQKRFLLHHLKSHGQYNCYFCSEKFVTAMIPRPPYACPKCENLPDTAQ